LDGLTEKKRGTFYRKSSAFLHFHEDPAGLFADVRDGDDWKRFPVNTAREQRTLLGRVRTLAGRSIRKRNSGPTTRSVGPLASS